MPVSAGGDRTGHPTPVASDAETGGLSHFDFTDTELQK